MRAPAAVVGVILVVGTHPVIGQTPTSEQLEMVRSRISSLEDRLVRIDAETRTRQQERERLSAELELAEARFGVEGVIHAAARTPSFELNAAVWPTRSAPCRSGYVV